MSNVKRIAIFSVTYDPFIGGAEVAIKEVTARLPEFEFDLFTAKLDSKLSPEEEIGNVKVYRVGNGSILDKWLYPWRASRLSLQKHKEKPYDLIHAVMATYAGLAALLFKKKSKIPYVLTLQSGDSDWFIRMRTWFWFWKYKQIYTKADSVTAISNWLELRARRYGHKKDITLIPNAVNVEQFSCSINFEERESIRKSWGVNENDFVVITTSRLVYKNGIDVLIGALEHLPSDVRLVIVGDGEEGSRFKVQGSKYGNRVVFLGHVDHGELPKLLKSSDVFVRPSRTEGLGNSFLEAMTAEIPIIGTRVGGIVDFLKDKETGLFAEVDNPKSVAEKVILLKDNHDLRNQIIKNSKQLVSEKYSWERIAGQYKNIYQTI